MEKAPNDYITPRQPKRTLQPEGTQQKTTQKYIKALQRKKQMSQTTHVDGAAVTRRIIQNDKPII